MEQEPRRKNLENIIKFNRNLRLLISVSVCQIKNQNKTFLSNLTLLLMSEVRTHLTIQIPTYLESREFMTGQRNNTTYAVFV